MDIVELDAIEELGHYTVGETVQGLHAAGILVAARASITLKAAGKVVGTEWWTRLAGHAAMMTAQALTATNWHRQQQNDKILRVYKIFTERGLF